ncbi:MAG: hypothetical protein ACK5OQ_16390 [Burkholderiales bacterium]|jgi:hypothetical protein
MPARIWKIDEGLKEFASGRQKTFIDAVNEHRGITHAEKALGVAKGTISVSIARVKKNAALAGYSPEHDMTKVVPEPYVVKGVSTYYDKEGKPRGQWVKSKLDHERYRELIKEAATAIASEVRGMAPVTPTPDRTMSDLLAVYPFGDPHFGMYAWGQETGEDFDLDIAERITQAAVDRLVASAPAAETAILLPLGDVLHMDDQTNQTPAHKHQLDADGRFVKVLHVCIKAYRHAVLRCLQKHKNVIVRFVSGNHDPHAVWSIAFTIAAYFDSDPRVTVDLSPAPFWFYRFGKVLIGATHGDKAKGDSLLGVMATDQAEAWGQTKFRYWYLGHVHHERVKELPGVTCESFRTLAAKDAYATAYGYRAGRDMRCIVHHREFGEIERHRCDVAMLDAISD